MEHENSRQFLLVGFSQQQGKRRFLFEGITADYNRTGYAVVADLNLARAYGIHLQELPLLCRKLLERRADSEVIRRFVFSEDEMRVHQATRVAAAHAASQKKRPPRRPQEHSGGGWRTVAQ